MIRTIAQWEFRRLTLSSPGLRTTILLALFPLAHLVPWKNISFFPDALQAAVTLSSLYALMIACMIGGDAGLMRRSAFWLFQKGIAPGDYAAGSLIVSALFGIAMILSSGLFVLFAALLYGFTPVAAFISSSVALLVFVILQAIFFLLGSLHMSRRTEIVLLFIFLSLFSNLLLLRTPEYLRKAVHLILPPASDAYGATTAMVNGSWHSAFGFLIHILFFVSVCLAVAFAVQRRLRPVPARLHVM